MMMMNDKTWWWWSKNDETTKRDDDDENKCYDNENRSEKIKNNRSKETEKWSERQ